MTKTSKLVSIALLLFVVGALIAGYMVQHHYALINGDAGFGSLCSISKTIDCDVVNASEFSEFLRIPMATLALSYFLLAAILCIVAVKSSYWRRETILFLSVLAGGSIAVSLSMFSITFFVLKSFCLMCLSIQAISLATFILLLLSVKSDGSITWQKTKPKRFIGFVVLGIALFAVTYGSTSQLKEIIPFDEEAFLNDFRQQPVVTIDPLDSPRQGFQGENPPLRLIEFADFQCPACGIAARYMHRLLKTYGDKVQLVFKSFPLDPSCNPMIKSKGHPFGCVSAKAAYCAKQQGKFEDFYKLLFGNQRLISEEQIKEWAKQLGLNTGQFESCLNSPEAAAAIQRDLDQGVKAGLESTPTFFANGKRVVGPITEEKLRLILKELGI